MRILIISNYYPPVEIGGWEQLTNDVVDELVARDHEIHVLTSDYLVDQIEGPEPAVSRFLHLESPDHVNYQIPYTFFHRGWEQNNVANLTQIAAEFEPDIIYINGMWNLPHSLAQAAEQLLPGRVVYYMASYWPTELDAHSAYWSLPAKNGFKRYPKNLLARIIKQYLVSSTPRNQLDFQLVLCVSSYVRDYMVEEAKVPREQTRVVHNGINLDHFKLKTEDSRREHLRLLYAGRLSADKGVLTILESLAMINKQNLAASIQCSIYGSGAPDYRARLTRFVAEHEIDSWVGFKGVVPRDQMPGVFAEHDVLLFPSVWAEPLARILQEAMACGLVVIGTNTGGTDEILQDGITGLTFEANDAQMLAEKIELVQSDEQLRERIIQAARRKVEKEFSLTRMVDEIEENFKWVLSQKVPALG
jgi:glycogen(starch) synthase